MRNRFVPAFVVVVAMLAASTATASAHDRGGGRDRDRGRRPERVVEFEKRSLSGAGNNNANVAWGQAGTNYQRLAPAHYADGVGAIAGGPNARYISNRIFNDNGQNLFSGNNISQWGWAWGQFLDHDMGLRNETPAEDASVPYNNSDPLEAFTNDTPDGLAINRTPAAPGSGPRDQVNTLSSFLDASNVYGVDAVRASWLSNPDGMLLMPNRYLPMAGARGNVATSPPMDLMGRLTGNPAGAVVAGDVRANENIALTSIQTLFAREHNRIVNKLPDRLSGTQKYETARRIVGAEVEYITYREFLPALGIYLPEYRGYDRRINPTLTNEFATVGFRAHSMVHGEFDVTFGSSTYTQSQLDAFSAQGIKVNVASEPHVLTIPLVVAFGNPGLLQAVGEGRFLASLSQERQYQNDETIDNSLRSVLFEIPKPGTTDPAACQTPVVDPRCFNDVADLGADDVVRGRDHGMPTYNDMRAEYGLRRVRSFREITGESTSSLQGMSIDDPHILDFTELRDADGNLVDPTNTDAVNEDVVTGLRRTTVAARLKAIYGTVDNIDAFVGMVSEKHVPGTEFGPLQRAIWRDQFLRLRDGDRMFYANDPALAQINQAYGITYQHTLADIISANTGETFLSPDLFHASGEG